MISLAVLLVSVGSLSSTVAPGEGDGARLGRAVLALSDLDGDGVRDFAVGAPAAVGKAGRVLVLSGADRSVLHVWDGEAGRQTFGHTLRVAGDVDGDGCDDVIVGYEYGARTEIRSGKDGRLFTAFDRADLEVHPFGDLDQDGCDELLLTAGQRWEVRSGCDGRLVGGLTYALEAGRFYSIGDVDGDGLADGVLVAKKTYLCRSSRGGSPDFVRPNPMPYQLQQPIGEVWPEVFREHGDHLTVRASGAGDLDGDGTSDLLMAFATPVRNMSDIGGQVQLVALSYSKRGRPLWTESRPLNMESGRADSMGYAVATPGDLDGDGRDDLVIAEGVEFTRVRVSSYESTEGEQLWKLTVPDVGYLTGLALSSLGDHDEDGVVDILVGYSDWYAHGPIAGGGTVTLVSGKNGERLWSIEESSFAEVLTVPGEGK